MKPIRPRKWLNTDVLFPVSSGIICGFRLRFAILSNEAGVVYLATSIRREKPSMFCDIVSASGQNIKREVMSDQRLGILGGGGPACGINSAVSADTIEAIKMGGEGVGVYDGVAE